MRRFFSILLFSAFITAGFIFTACDNDSDSTNTSYQERIINPSSTKSASTLSLYADPEISISESEAAVNITFTPEDAQVKVFCDTNIVSFVEQPEEIGGSYLVRYKPKTLGAFEITAKSGTYTSKISINVTTKLTSLEITGNSSPIEKGASTQLSAKKTPVNAPGTVKWASSDEKIATVDQSGLVTAVAPGIATITATVIGNESGSFNNDNIVAGYFDVTVKGFFLSGTDFYLCQRDEYDEVEAKVIEIEGATVEWTSSDTTLFTVETLNTEKTKAKLVYVDKANGEGTVTAILKDSSGKELAKDSATVYVSNFYMLALGDSIAAGYASKAMDSGDKDLEEEKMVEAYTKYMERRKNGKDPNYVNEYSYPAILRNKLSKKSNLLLQSYAMAGDNTEMLLKKLDPDYRDATIATEKGEIQEALSQADYITLCIGANDILLKVFGKELIFQKAEWFRDAFNAELDGFKSRYDKIIEKLTDGNRHVYAMSIYSPYKYFNKEYIPASQFTGYFKGMIEKVIKINEYAEPVIAKINDYIKKKAEANDNMTFVDVAPIFDQMTNEEHKKYLHPIPERMNFLKVISTGGSSIPLWFDPHPTIIGAEKIAEKYKEAMEPEAN